MSSSSPRAGDIPPCRAASHQSLAEYSPHSCFRRYSDPCAQSRPERGHCWISGHLGTYTGTCSISHVDCSARPAGHRSNPAGTCRGLGAIAALLRRRSFEHSPKMDTNRSPGRRFSVSGKGREDHRSRPEHKNPPGDLVSVDLRKKPVYVPRYPTPPCVTRSGYPGTTVRRRRAMEQCSRRQRPVPPLEHRSGVLRATERGIATITSFRVAPKYFGNLPSLLLELVGTQ